jgi:hypothetical protein
LDIRSDVIGMMSNSKYQKVKLECERVIQHSIYRHDYKNRFGHFERVDGNVTTFSSAPKPCGANCPLCKLENHTSTWIIIWKTLQKTIVLHSLQCMSCWHDSRIPISCIKNSTQFSKMESQFHFRTNSKRSTQMLQNSRCSRMKS